ncbi:MAG: hypothetical protein AB1589_07930 [Cyanobacteriota bacterium]
MFGKSPIEKLSPPTLNSVHLPELVELDEQEQESIAGGESSLSEFKIQGLILELNPARAIVTKQFIVHPNIATLP